MPENEVPFQRLRAAIVKLARVALNDRAHAAGSSYVAEASRSRTNVALSMNPHCVRDGVSRSATTRACFHSGALGSTRPSQFNRDSHRIRSVRSEEHTSELQSLITISYAVFCL